MEDDELPIEQYLEQLHSIDPERDQPPDEQQKEENGLKKRIN